MENKRRKRAGMIEDIKSSRSYDIVVVGAGHAGCEAAHAAALKGLSVLIVSLNASRIGWMSCNPSVGGVAKGHLVKEVDALGGLMAGIVDATGIQFRVLNASRGLAVRGSRAQCDRVLYARTMRETIEALPGIDILEDLVEEIVCERLPQEKRVVGVVTESGLQVKCKALVITTGTFLRGVSWVGSKQEPCGREGERPSIKLSASLVAIGLKMGRFKTGTTPRLDGRTIDYDCTDKQSGDDKIRPFSFSTDPQSFPRQAQVPCFITKTNEQTQRIIRENIHLSAVSRIGKEVIPPRYCPSIEEKIRRFPERTGHTIYIEPEGLNTHEVYPAGLSTSFPVEIQLDILRTIRGFEKVEIVSPGYAIEYDYIVPTQLEPTLKVRGVHGLFSAGQINGTSGYEEAAAQGLVAGINAALSVLGEKELVLGREVSYIGVLIDDITGIGTKEPYRIMTSRAEHRLYLREDNADLRLTDLAYSVGLVSSDRVEEVKRRNYIVESECRRLESSFALKGGGLDNVAGNTLATVLRRPGVTYTDLEVVDPDRNKRVIDLNADTVQANIQYAGYIERSRRWIHRLRELEDLSIPDTYNYDHLPGLSSEIREILKQYAPRTVGQASRIPGITPAAIHIIGASLVYKNQSCG